MSNLSSIRKNGSVYRFTWLAILGIILFFVVSAACILALLQPSAFQPVGRTLSFPGVGAEQNTLTPTVVITPTVVTTPTPKPVHTTMLLPFTAGKNAKQVHKNEIAGATTLTINGSGQASGKRFSDAFYIYTDQSGNAIKPILTTPHSSLTINGKFVRTYLEQIPPYSPSHTYTLELKTWEGDILTFGIPDDNLQDNTGAFLIAFSN